MSKNLVITKRTLSKIMSLDLPIDRELFEYACRTHKNVVDQFLFVSSDKIQSIGDVAGLIDWTGRTKKGENYLSLNARHARPKWVQEALNSTRGKMMLDEVGPYGTPVQAILRRILHRSSTTLSNDEQVVLVLLMNLNPNLSVESYSKQFHFHS